MSLVTDPSNAFSFETMRPTTSPDWFRNDPPLFRASELALILGHEWATGVPPYTSDFN
jgi:hypothetical protein